MAARLSPSGWLSGPAFDLGLMIGPTLLACAVAAALPDAVGLSAVGWLLLVVFIDVGHVWATGLRLWTDRSPGHLRRALLLPLAVAIALISVQLVVPHWYWRGMALLAVFHFLRQQVGIAMVYRHAAGLPPGPDARWERAAARGAGRARCRRPCGGGRASRWSSWRSSRSPSPRRRCGTASSGRSTPPSSARVTCGA